MNKRQVGGTYEKLAAGYLEQKGFVILEYNYRCKIGEIDLIAKDGTYLVFIEVKYRKNAAGGSPLQAVGRTKQRTISKVADYYLLTHSNCYMVPCRFDVVGILGEEIIHIANAFEYCS